MNDRPSDYMHGAVFLLEDSETREGMRKKCRDAKELGLNLAVIWPPVFYRNGKRDFRIQKEFLECAEETGLNVIVELTGQVANLEYLPDCEWNGEYAVRNPDGSIAPMQNGLGEVNYNHPEVKRKIAEFFRAAVNALGSHPALFAWDIWNETHFKSFDTVTIRKFQDFLARKYESVERLNSVWKKSYTSFRQIRIDPITWASIAPDCDWEEFRTDNLTEIAAEWAGILREADPGRPVFADNVMSNAVWSEFDRGTDDWKLARTVDLFGISFYPKTGGRLLKENAAWLRLLTFAGAASAGNGRFMVAEMQSHCYSEIFTRERVSPEELTAWNLEALFQGSRGCVYWKWEPFKAGFQLGGRGLVLADGSFSKRAEAVRRFSHFLAEHPDARHLRPMANAALLYDPASNFTVKAVNNRIRHIIGDDQCARARFGAAKIAYERNIPLAVVTPRQLAGKKSDFKLLILPYQLTMNGNLAETLFDYMNAGGILAAGCPFADIDEDGRLFETLPGGPFQRLLGVRATDVLPDTFRGEEIERQELENLSGGADVVLHSDSGAPLLLRRKHGKGGILYFASSVWNHAFDQNRTCAANAFFEVLLRECPSIQADVPPATLPVVAARGEKEEYLLIENEEQKEECRFADTSPLKRIFGEGEVLQTETGTIVRNPRNCVLQLEKKEMES